MTDSEGEPRVVAGVRIRHPYRAVDADDDRHWRERLSDPELVTDGGECLECGETWEEDPARKVECPTCGAAVGSPCKRPSGWTCSPHAARYEAAVPVVCPLDDCLAVDDDESEQTTLVTDGGIEESTGELLQDDSAAIEFPESFDQWPYEDRIEYLSKVVYRDRLIEHFLWQLSLNHEDVFQKSGISKDGWARIILTIEDLLDDRDRRIERPQDPGKNRDEEHRTDGGRDVDLSSKWCPVCGSPTLWNGECNRTGCPGPDPSRLAFDGGSPARIGPIRRRWHRLLTRLHDWLDPDARPFWERHEYWEGLR